MWLIPLLLVMIMTGCDERIGLNSPPLVTTPTVSSTNPANNAVAVPFNQKVTVTFSEAMDSATITTATFTLMQGSSFVSGTVSYTGTTATFAPSSNLAPNTLYIVTITTMAKNVAGSALATNYVWSFTTGSAAAIVPPTVSSTDPVNAASGIPINQKIAATFSVAMDASTITTSTFTLLQGTTPVPGFVSYSGITAIFGPSSNLAPNTAYTVSITTGSKDLAGNSLVNNYVWSFTTGAGVVITPPIVNSTDPVNNETGVALNQKIAATFSKTMDATTITAATFTLKQGATSIAGFVSYSGTTAIFAPSINLAPNTLYTVTITTGVKDLASNALANNYVWSFTSGAAAIVTPPTVSSTDPANAETGVAFNQKVAATFSKTMDASTITTATFTLMQGITFVSGTVVYVGTTATYIPSSNLAPNTTYTATITTEAKDLTGNALVTNYVWNFTTGAAVVIIPPTVSLTDPLNLATDVALNQKIAATFSKTMDASTITTATFTLMQGTTSVSGFVSYSGKTTTFAPASILLPNKLYTATITTGSKDLAGNALVADYVWTFTTGAAVVVTPPTVNSTDPADLATAVALNQKVAATFSRTMDASTITTATFTIKQGTTSVSGFVSYSGTTAIFAPASNLLASTLYTATITTGSKDLSGNALASNYVWTFTTGSAVVIVPPTVSLTDPLNLATGVALNQKIAATFSKTMDASTITTATYTLTQGTTPVSGFVSYSGTTAIFAPTDNLFPNTLYTATITTGAKDLSGNALAAKYVWTFTTGSAVAMIPPTVTLTDPLDAATGVPLNQKISATFSKTMDAVTIQTSTYSLKQGTTTVTGFVSYSGTTAVFAPASNLLPNTVYTVTITTGVKDLAGNALASNYVWSFTTGSSIVSTTPTITSTDPVDAATCVALNKQITATFSNTMDASTITTAIFTIMETGGTTFVSGTVSYVGTTATFTTLTNFKPNTTYIATITTGAKDLAGNSMASNYVWRFTTVIPYTVTLSSNPAAGGTTTGSGTFNSCSSVTVTATPNPGYTFTNWTENGNIVSTNTSYTFTLNGNTALVANFAVTQYTVTLSANPAAGGTVTQSGTGTYDSGSSVTVTATPNAGYTFTSWKENGSVIPAATASYTFTISGNRTLEANFTALVQLTVTLSANPPAGGLVTQSGTGSYDFGSSVTVTATPNPGYTFTSWKENGLVVPLANASYTFTIMGNRTLEANFTATVVQYTVTLSANPPADGIVTQSGTGTYISGSSVTVTATPNAGFKFINWTEGGIEVSTTASYQFTITGDRILVGNFAVSVVGQLPVNLGSAARFAILSNSAITNIPTSAITGDVGISPGARSTITGFVLTPDASNTFSTSPEVTGQVFAADDAVPTPAMLILAKTDANLAYLDATAAVRGTPTPISGNINGLTLVPGLYESGTSIEISPGGKLYLDAQGDASAVFIIRSATSITTSATSEVVLTGSANPANIFWSAGSAVTLGVNSKMNGTIIASTSISLLTGARLDGRALIQSAAAGQVSLDQNIIVKP